MYFDESAYFLDCSTGFISRSRKAWKEKFQVQRRWQTRWEGTRMTAQGTEQGRWLTVMFVWRLFVLARERNCEAFTSQQRTSSPGKLQSDQ